MPTFRLAVVLATVLAAAAPPAFAHDGNAGSWTFAAGLLHPFSGHDHIAAMVAVGVLAHLTGWRGVWRLPVAFISAMVVGALAARGGLALPMVETMIALSVAVVGGLVVLGWRVTAPLGGLVMLFAVFHGNAHGLEAPADDFAAYIAGFSFATATLHLGGIGLADVMGRRLPDRHLPVRMFGGATAAFGLLLLTRLA